MKATNLKHPPTFFIIFKGLYIREKKNCGSEKLPGMVIFLPLGDGLLDWSPVSSASIKNETRKDPLPSWYCESGWPDSSLIGVDFTPYCQRKDELTYGGPT